MSIFFIISMVALGLIGILALIAYMYHIVLKLNLPDDDQDFI